MCLIVELKVPWCWIQFLRIRNWICCKTRLIKAAIQYWLWNRLIKATGRQTISDYSTNVSWQVVCKQVWKTKWQVVEDKKRFWRSALYTSSYLWAYDWAPWWIRHWPLCSVRMPSTVRTLDSWSECHQGQHDHLQNNPKIYQIIGLILHIFGHLYIFPLFVYQIGDMSQLNIVTVMLL